MMKVKDELPIASKEPIEPVSSTESLTLHKEPTKRSRDEAP